MINSTFDNSSMKVFCGRHVNTKDYYTTFGDNKSELVNNKQINASFMEFGWLDISSYTLDDDRLSNIAVRAEQNIGTTDEDIAHSFKVEGWDCGYFPPIVGTEDGIPRDGRTRIRAALMCGEKWIPCAFYSYKNSNSVKDNVTNGLVANKHRPQKRATWQDFIAAGVNIVLSGELPNDPQAIEYWLRNDVGIGYFYSNVGGNITKLANQIYDKAKRNSHGHLLILRDRKDWMEWLLKAFDKQASYYRQQFNIQSIDDIAFYESGGNRAEQVYCRYLLPNASQGIVTNIILYSNEDDPIVAESNHNFFVEQLEKFHEEMYDWINKEISGVRVMQPDKNRMWKVIGIIPQFLTGKQDKMRKNHILASMDDLPKTAPTLYKIFNSDQEEEVA